MNKLLFFLCILGIGSCGIEERYRQVERSNPGCTIISETDESITIKCGNSESSIPKGTNGKDGKDGSDGADGFSSLIHIIEESSCEAGGYTILTALDSNSNGIIDSADDNMQVAEVCNGVDGLDGQDGKDGIDGIDGKDGKDGQDGKDAVFQPVEVIDPCGDMPGVNDEVLLKLPSGMIIALFMDNAGGKNTRLASLSAGDYMTTDGTKCYFRVQADGTITNERY